MSFCVIMWYVSDTDAKPLNVHGRPAFLRVTGVTGVGNRSEKADGTSMLNNK